jgi:wyosine [tRNA(Phe)-imidazoG37] synthetase (radical SAM superfamily)
MFKFAKSFQGEFITKTMLIKGVNDSIYKFAQLADFLKRLEPNIAYLAIPTRPPAERIEPATERVVNTAYKNFRERCKHLQH